MLRPPDGQAASTNLNAVLLRFSLPSRGEASLSHRDGACVRGGSSCIARAGLRIAPAAGKRTSREDVAPGLQGVGSRQSLRSCSKYQVLIAVVDAGESTRARAFSRGTIQLECFIFSRLSSLNLVNASTSRGTAFYRINKIGKRDPVNLRQRARRELEDA